MKARYQVYLAVFALALTALAAALRIADAAEGGIQRSEWADIGVAVALLGLPLVLVAQARRVVAEHGPDYVPPSARYSRVVLLIAAAVAFVLAAVAAWLIATR